MMEEKDFMALAIREAKKAEAKDEVPVGCVIVKDGKVVARAYNTREKDQNALHHAEIKAIAKACKKLNSWRLCGCTLYVTLEPCPMCAGAIVNSRIEKVVFGAPDEKAGCFGTMLNLNDYPLYKPQIEGGVMTQECAKLLGDFFKNKRKKGSI